MSTENKIYIGDGVYCEFSGYDFRLYTSNGITEENVIHLEFEHIQTLKAFADRVTNLDEVVPR